MGTTFLDTEYAYIKRHAGPLGKVHYTIDVHRVVDSEEVKEIIKALVAGLWVE